MLSIAAHLITLQGTIAPFADLTPMRGVKIRSNRRGYAQLTGFYPCDEAEAYMSYEPQQLLGITAHWQGLKIWEGRLEDARADAANGGVHINALGNWRALYDVPYTALWSTTRFDDWRPVTPQDSSAYRPDRWQIDTNSRLYIAPKENEYYDITDDRGGLTFAAPHNGARNIAVVTFDYAVTVPSATWVTRLLSYTDAFGGVTVEWTQSGSGSGSATVTLTSPSPRLVFELFYNSGTETQWTGARTGSAFMRITNLRIKSTASASLYADEIARALASFVNGVNPARLSADASMIESPGLDLRDEVYEDLWPGDILARLAALGDNQTPPRRWEVAIWEDKRLRFQPLGSDGLVWYVDVPDHILERTMESMTNSAYAVYQEPGGRTLRTAVADDADAQARYDMIRRAPTKAQTTSSVQAGVIRDAFLNDRKDPIPRARIPFDRVYNQGGGEYPPFVVLPGHTLVLRSLSPVAVTASDRVRSFVVDSTEYDVDSGWMTATPEIPPPGLETLLARRAAGVGV